MHHRREAQARQRAAQVKEGIFRSPAIIHTWVTAWYFKIVRIVEYKPEHFALLHTAAARTASRNLRSRDFVNHYYASVPWCRLYLLLSREDIPLGLLGLERMPFYFGTRPVTLGFATNYHSLETGAGGFLFLHWIKNCDVAISFGGSADTHNLIRSQKWPYFEGVGVYLLNKPYNPYPGQPAWKRAAKWVARHTKRRPISHFAPNVPQRIHDLISVQEETEYDEDLLPQNAPFELRLAPDVDYLAWRYNTRLPFVRYRLFRIHASGRTSGYVILNENADRILVSQCDGEDPEALAWGVVLSILELCRRDRTPRTVMLTCCHPTMQEIFRSFGFKADSTHAFALGPLRPGIGPPPEANTSNWLINYDWGDNGLMDLC